MFHRSSINLSNETEPWRADLNSKSKHTELIKDNEVYSIFFPIDSTKEASLPDAFEITFWKKKNPKLKYLDTCFSGSSFKLLIFLS